MQEDIENKTVRLAITVAKVTVQALRDSLHTYMDSYRNHSLSKLTKGESKSGKQSVKDLIGQGQGVSSIPITEGGLKDFKKIANKYGVDFAIVKDKSENPPKFTIFFKAKDADAITQVMKEYSAKMVKREKEKKPSVLQKLKKLKAIVAQQPRKEKERRKEQQR